MKKRKILLIVAAVIVLALLISALIVLRKDMKLILSDAAKELRYYPVTVLPFDKVDLPANWNIKFKQDRECKLELATEGNVPLEADAKTMDGTLFFQDDTTGEALRSANVYARITMPSLNSIIAGQGTKIRIDNFQFDSLIVLLRDSAVFTGKNNGFKNLSFKTSGAVSIRLSNTMAN